MRLIKTGSKDPYYNIALEEYVFNNMIDEDYLIVYQSNRSVDFGVDTDPYDVIHLGNTQKSGVAVIRRFSEGPVIYQDEGTVNFSFIMSYTGDPSEQLPIHYMKKYFDSIGIEYELTDLNEIRVQGKVIYCYDEKILNNRLLHHGTIFLDVDSDALKEVIKSANGNDVTDMEAVLKEQVNPEEVVNIISDEMSEYVINRIQRQVVSAIAKEKYQNWGWNSEGVKSI